MRDAAVEALRFATGKVREDFDHDRKLVLAILKDLEIIGEAASRVSMTAKQGTPTVPSVPGATSPNVGDLDEVS
jgi:uncharacterized protein with HEPN domain